MTTTSKQCKQCGQVKLLSEFYAKRAECKECSKKRPYLKSATHKAQRFLYKERNREARKLPGAATTKEITSLLSNAHTCDYCGCELTKKSIDHIIPLSKGGTHELTNLSVCCPRCNSSKRATDVNDWMGKKMTKRRGRPQQYTRIRLETLNKILGGYLGRRLYAEASAIEFAMRSLNVHKDEAVIQDAKEQMEQFLKEN